MTGKIGIIGLGLIGGSLALDFRAKGIHVIGHDASDAHEAQAKELRLVDSCDNLDQLIVQASVIIVAVPVHHTASLIHRVLDQVSAHSVVIDTASTKASICEAVAQHKNRARFVACHPLAGTEHSGPTAAISGLFKQKKNIICQGDYSDQDALEQVLHLWESIGAESFFMDAENHDKHMAYVSHLSHVSSFMLGSTVLDIEEDEKNIFNLASTGFASTVRLAKSSPATWTSIFIDNKKHILEALHSYQEHLKKIEQAISNEDHVSLQKQMQRANHIKKVLKSGSH